MDFGNQQRTYSINIGESPHSMELGVQCPPVPLELQSTTFLPTELPRFYLGNVVDGTVVTFSPHLVPHHSLQQHPIVEESRVVHQTIMTQQTSNSLSSGVEVQPNSHIQNVDILQNQLHEGNIQSTTSPNNSLPFTSPFSNMNIGTEPTASSKNDTISNHLNSSWCLICNTSIDNTTDAIDIIHTTTTATGRTLKTILKRLTLLNIKTLQSKVICSKCFTLIDDFDFLELKLVDAEMQILKSFQSTLNLHHSDIIFKTINKKLMLNQCESSDSSDDSMNEDPDDPDVTAESLMGRKKKSIKKSNKSIAGELKHLKTLESSTSSHSNIPRKKRGRPRKDEPEAILPGESSRECPHCKQIVSLCNYLKHVMKHRMLPCPFCQAVFKRKELKTHLRESHKSESKFPCVVCERKFDSYSRLHRHWLLLHEGSKEEKNQCSVCSKLFSSPSALKFHLNTLHMKKNQFQCYVCKERFTQKGNMQDHIRRMHFSEDSKKFNCPSCPKKFVGSSDLQKHINGVHLKIKKAVCSICSKPFFDSRALKIHINAIHTKEIQYSCPDCEMVFFSHNNMVTHRRRIHFSNASRKFPCRTCDKRFCSPSDLLTHVQVVHDTVRKHICDICGQAFKVASNLKYHRRKHSGETPYPCPHCPKSFRGPSHIADHVKKVHKTVYLSMKQRRRLNLPENAPPPPPGIIPVVEKAKKCASTSCTSMELEDPTRAIVQPSGTAQLMAPGISTMTFQNHQAHPNMVLGASNCLTEVQPTGTITDLHSSNSYSNDIHFGLMNNQSTTPTVVKFLHEMQF